MYDVVIIGAGVIGSAIARELARYDIRICVVEKEEDVCCGTSKANSGIVHAGFDAVPGSLKAKLNVRGSQMMEKLSQELDFPYRKNGSVVLCFDERKIDHLEQLMISGRKNGVAGLRIVTGKKMRHIEPSLSDEVKALLYAPEGGIVCPFKLTIALAENANMNGVEFRFNTKVTGIQKQAKGFAIKTENSGVIRSQVVVNAAGIYADLFHNMVSDDPIKITPRKGEYCLFDKKAGRHVSRTVFQMPTKMGKGVLVTPTVHGNLMIGPTAYDIADREGTQTTAEGLKEVIGKSRMSIADLPLNQIITSFAGLRAHADRTDFIIGEVADAAGFFDAAGIESPGLSSAPAIGELLAGLISNKYRFEKKKFFLNERTDIVSIVDKPFAEVAELIRKCPEYGTIICRCEEVTEGEILDAIRRPLGARSLDGVKRRTRAGSGRCQAGFCAPRIVEILARELGDSTLQVSKSGRGSELLAGYTKEG